MTNKLSILGSTGSIGTQALDVVRMRGIDVTALCVHNNVNLLEKQAREFKPNLVAVYDENKYKQLKNALADIDIKVEAGFDGLCACAEEKECDTVLNSVVGMIGLVPTLTAINAGKNVALANKETLVAGGEPVMRAAKQKGIKMLPVDSEHSAIFQCLQASPRKEALKRIILTASGGPFFGKTAEQLKEVTIYDKDGNIFFSAPEKDFKGLIYTHEAHFLIVNLEGKKYTLVLQDAQYHPVTDRLLHADFIQVVEDKPVVMNIPVDVFGDSAAVKAGGKLLVKKRHLKVKGLSNDLPEELPIDISNLKLNHSIRVADMKMDNLEFVDLKSTPIVTIAASRSMSAVTEEESSTEAAAE